MFWNFKRKIRLVCFDIDNTLCDFASAETIAEAQLSELISKDIKRLQSKVKRRGAVTNSCSAFTVLKTFNDVKRLNLYKDSKPETYSRMLWFKETIEALDDNMSLGVNINKLLLNSYSYETRYWDIIGRNMKNYPNALSTLESLNSKGLKLATITDSDGRPGIKDHRMRLLGLDKYFDYIITGDDVGLNKPAVENWDKLLGMSGFKARECMMIGDHPQIDLATAKKLGFITVWTKESLNNDARQKYVDYEIKDIGEVLVILEKINGK